MKDYAISGISTATGSKVQTIRYYEQIGLMPEPPRTKVGNGVTQANTSSGSPLFVTRGELGLISRQSVSFSRLPTSLSAHDEPERSCGEVDRIARQHVVKIDSKIERLTGLRKEMQRMISCRQGRIADCRVIGALAEHGG
jgi:DNA-binding transcriptional MerR regulator